MPTFHPPMLRCSRFLGSGITFTGLAAPSRGSRRGGRRVTVDPGTPPKIHQLTREEILIVTAGSATAL